MANASLLLFRLKLGGEQECLRIIPALSLGSVLAYESLQNSSKWRGEAIPELDATSMWGLFVMMELNTRDQVLYSATLTLLFQTQKAMQEFLGFFQMFSGHPYSTSSWCPVAFKAAAVQTRLGNAYPLMRLGFFRVLARERRGFCCKDLCASFLSGIIERLNKMTETELAASKADLSEFQLRIGFPSEPQTRFIRMLQCRYLCLLWQAPMPEDLACVVGGGAKQVLRECCPEGESDEERLRCVHDALVPLLVPELLQGMPVWQLNTTQGRVTKSGLLFNV